MPTFIGVKNRNVEPPKSFYSDNTRSSDITSEGIRDGMKQVWDIFEKKGVLEDLKASAFFRTTNNG